MSTNVIIGYVDCTFFFFVLFLFVAVAAWSDIQEKRKKKLAPFVDWEAVLEEIQGTLDEYDDSHVW